MLYNDPSDDLLLMTILSLLQGRPPIGTKAIHSHLPHDRRILVRVPTCDAQALQDWALGERDELDVLFSHGEVEQTQARVSTLVRGRLDDAVYNALIVSPREDLHDLAQIYDLHGQCRMRLVSHR